MGLIEIANAHSDWNVNRVPSGMSGGIVQAGDGGSRKVDFNALYDSNKNMCGAVYGDGQTGDAQDEVQIKGEKWDMYKYIALSTLGILMDPIGGTASVLVDCIGDVLGMGVEQKQVKSVVSEEANPQDRVSSKLAQSAVSSGEVAGRLSKEADSRRGPFNQEDAVRSQERGDSHLVSLTPGRVTAPRNHVSLTPPKQQGMAEKASLSPKANGFNKVSRGMTAASEQDQSQGNAM